MRRVTSVDEPDEQAPTVVTQSGKHGTEDAVLRGHLQMVVIGNGTFSTHPLPVAAAVTIGRSSRCDIPVDDESISRRHAILTIGETMTIEDVGSANGTRVRGNKLRPGRPTQISVGELVGLGKVSIILQQRSSPVRARRLWTHDYFETRLEEECARADRSGAPFALMRIHPDHSAPASFIEETLGELVRDSDVLGKYGPHEYEVLLPDTPPGKADEALRRIDGKLVERGVKCRILTACYPRDGRTAYELAAKVQPPATQPKPATIGTDIVVADPQMQSLYRLVAQVAPSQIGALLLGETGVGKEVFAQALHRASPRAAGPFVELNCAALTESLLESELFGHEKGAFTHAQAAKPGLLETAHGGTLLLDEVGDMPLNIQVKLLRVIETSQLRRVGGLKTRTIDVRFVAATNSDLEEQIARGGFRRDLFFRLNGVTIVIPPLRERLPELEPLARMFISRAWTRGDAPPPELAPDALDLMRSYSWPGNIRELKHMVERAVLLCDRGPIRAEHLPAEKMRATLLTSRADHPSWPPPRQADAAPPRELPPLNKVHRKGSPEEQQWIMQALESAGGNQTVAARLLGISRRTLVNRLNDYDEVQRPRKVTPKRGDD